MAKEKLKTTRASSTRSGELEILPPANGINGSAAGQFRRQPNETAYSAHQRQQMISENAYFRALNRGFQGGDPVEDWVTAEREIGERLQG